MILVDAGPLIAILSRDDDRHEECVRVLKSFREPMASVWPAITEAMYFLNASWKAQDALWEMIVDGSLSVLSLEVEDCPRIRELMGKYRDLPMDLADAALVQAAERERISRVFTIDKRDFERYRPRGIGHFQIVP